MLRKPQPIKRANKNRPSQISSKRAVSTLRVAPGLSAAEPGHHGRDPRFDSCSVGTADEHAWQQKYSFVFDQQRDELKDMQRQLTDSKSASKKRLRGGGENRKRGRAKRLSEGEAEELKLEINRRSNQLKQREQAAEKQRIATAARKEEVEAVRQGKRPFFEKKSALQERQLKVQFEQLERKGGLDKFMEKKRKKRASKQRRQLPDQDKSAW